MSEKLFPSDESWQIELRGPVEDVVTQLRGLVRVPEAHKQALADNVDALWPETARSGTLVAVKIFCRVNKLEQRGRPAKRELHLNGSIVEI